MSPDCGLSGSLDILNKRKSTPPSVSRNTQNVHASVDGNLANDGDSMSITSKVITRELSNSLITDIYLRCRMDFTSNVVGTEAPHIVDFGLLALNTLGKFNTFGTQTTSIVRPTDGTHWYTLDHVFREATAVGTNGTRSELDYSYKTDFRNWREN